MVCHKARCHLRRWLTASDFFTDAQAFANSALAVRKDCSAVLASPEAAVNCARKSLSSASRLSKSLDSLRKSVSSVSELFRAAVKSPSDAAKS